MFFYTRYSVYPYNAERNVGCNVGRNVGNNIDSNGCSNVGSEGGRNVGSNVGSNVDRNVIGEAKKIEKQALEDSTSNISIKKKLSTSLPDLYHIEQIRIHCSL